MSSKEGWHPYCIIMLIIYSDYITEFFKEHIIDNDFFYTSLNMWNNSYLCSSRQSIINNITFLTIPDLQFSCRKFNIFLKTSVQKIQWKIYLFIVIYANVHIIVTHITHFMHYIIFLLNIMPLICYNTIFNFIYNLQNQ